MRRISITEPEIDWWIMWRAKCTAATDEVIRAYAAGEPICFDGALYREHKYEFLMSTTGPFRGKCAYCDAYIFRQHGDVEHYRPKGPVTDENDRPVTRERNGNREEHPGYYWLVYDWRNLLPSCQICNVGNNQMSGTGKPGKRNRFPVYSGRAWTQGEEDNETPVLVNPTIDDPSEHIGFETSGVAFERDDRGGQTIKILGLNDYDFPTHRRRRYMAVRRQVESYIQSHQPGEPNDEEQSEIRDINNGVGEYTRMALLGIRDALEEASAKIRAEQNRVADAIEGLGENP